MTKDIIYGFESLKKLEAGVNKLANAVSVTLGPKGKNVVIDRKYTSPLITNDGVSIAREINLQDKFENIGANILKEASTRTNDEAGDGTTTACILTQAIINEGIKQTSVGYNPILIRRGLFKALNNASEIIKTNSKSIKTNEEIQNIATISTGDEGLGELIANAFIKVGKDGIITIQDSKTTKTEIKIVDGLSIDKGYVSPYFITNSDKMTCELENSKILITDKKISSISEIMPILENSANNCNPLLIIAEDIENEALSALVLNKMRGTLNVAVVKAPSYGDKQKAILQDIATLSGGTFISSDLGLNLTNCIDKLGQFKSIKITKDSTTFTGGVGNQKEILKRISEIETQISDCDNDFDKTMLSERLAKLRGGIGIIYVGASSDIELQEKKLRIEDGISATKSALMEGITSGGGISLINCIPKLKALSNTLSNEEKIGVEILINALTKPLLQICKNAGVSGEVVLDKIMNSTNTNFGFDALKCEYVDMFKSGIIDPTKVVLSTLTNSVSVAATLLTSDVLITDLEENK